jgi:GAF domain-containing protein
VQPVFDAVVRTAVNLLACDLAGVIRCDDTSYSPVAGASPAGPVTDMGPPVVPIDPALNFPSRVIASKAILHLPDWNAIEVPEHERGMQALLGINASLMLPMLRDGVCIGGLALMRKRAGAFDDKEIALASSFADQALIAIENVRLFTETQEALKRQTATADMLRVISSSPTDVQPVFDAIVSTAVPLIGCDKAFVLRLDGQRLRLAAGAGRSGLIADLADKSITVDPVANFPSRVVVDKQALHLPDWATIELPEYERGVHESGGVNASLMLPLLHADECVGVLSLGRARAQAFTATEIALAESFRDQAVIAIQNARLFGETQEALERQTATAEVLQVIGSSMANTTPVFEAILRSCLRAFSLDYANFAMLDEDGSIHLVQDAANQPSAEWRRFIEHERAQFPRPARESIHGYAIHKGQVLHYPDVANGPGVPEGLRQTRR